MLDDYKVYRHWYDFTNWTIQKVDTFPKSVRYSVSGRIMNLTLEIMENVICSVYNQDRITRLDETNLKVKILGTLWRISLDNRWISVKNYEYICSNVDTFGRMIGGWLKDEKNRQSL